VPIQNVSREMWPEVLANKAQVEAWKDLFAIEPKTDLLNQKGKVNERFVEEHPTSWWTPATSVRISKTASRWL